MIREVNASPYGLSGSLWTNDLRRALRVASRSKAACSASIPTAASTSKRPSAGSSRAVLAATSGMAAMEGYTELKNVYVADD